MAGPHQVASPTTRSHAGWGWSPTSRRSSTSDLRGGPGHRRRRSCRVRSRATGFARSTRSPALRRPGHPNRHWAAPRTSARTSAPWLAPFLGSCAEPSPSPPKARSAPCSERASHRTPAPRPAHSAPTVRPERPAPPMLGSAPGKAAPFGLPGPAPDRGPLLRRGVDANQRPSVVGSAPAARKRRDDLRHRPHPPGARLESKRSLSAWPARRDARARARHRCARNGAAGRFASLAAGQSSASARPDPSRASGASPTAMRPCVPSRRSARLPERRWTSCWGNAISRPAAAKRRWIP